MAEKKPAIRIDPELVRQLDAAAEAAESVEAVFMLQSDDPSQAVPSAERTEELARLVLNRVKQRTGETEDRVNVFTQLGSFVVSASASFIREVMSEPEIAAAVANRQPGSSIEKQSGNAVQEMKPKKRQTR
jgi:hypothetical protein